MSQSLLHVLTQPRVSVETFASTELANHLIKVIGQDVCTFKRNNQTSYCLVSRARDIRDHINLLIKQVEADSTDDWTAYDLYTATIDLLEDFLWGVVPVTESESQVPLLHTGTSLDDCLLAIDTWTERRASIRNFSSRIFSSEIKLKIHTPSIADTDRKEAEKYDDLNLFSALSTNINTFSPRNPSEYESSALNAISIIKTNVKSILSLLTAGQRNDDSIVLTIQCIMLINSVVVLCDTVAEGQWSKSLKSSHVWQEASKLVSDTKSHLDRSIPLDTLKAHYNKFIATLKAQPGQPKLKLPLEYNQLRGYVAKVRHPYFTQARVLVDQCRLLVEHIKKEGDKHTERTPHLDAALKDAIKALSAAAEIPPVVTKLNEGGIPTDEVGKALQSAEGKLEQCYKEYGLSEWEKRKEAMNNARERDQERTAKLTALNDNRNLKGLAGTGDKSADKISVSIITHELSSFKSLGSNTKTYEEDKSATLNALLWNEASTRRDRAEFFQKAYFQKEDPRTSTNALSLDTEVGSLVSQQNRRLTLYLVIRK